MPRESRQGDQRRVLAAQGSAQPHRIQPLANDYSILWTEISKTYPSLAEALNDLQEVLT